MTTTLPVELQAQLIDTACSIFWYKKSLIHFLSSVGVPQPFLDEAVSRLRTETKRAVFYDLIGELIKSTNPQGRISVERMVQQLSTWSKFSGLDDPEAARRAVIELSALAEKYSWHIGNTSETQQTSANRQEKLAGMLETYLALTKSANPQQRGRDLEGLLYSLFQFENLNPELPFRLDGEQIDGAFELENIHYLIEAKWEQAKVSPDYVAWFKVKVDRKLAGTRGLLISVNGFTDEAVRTARDAKTIILMDGYDLYSVLQPLTDLTLKELLLQKISAFARQGSAFISAKDILELRNRQRIDHRL